MYYFETITAIWGRHVSFISKEHTLRNKSNGAIMSELRRANGEWL